jgi:hypothetical protein
MFAKSLTLAAAAALTVATFGSTAAEARGWHDDGPRYGHYDRGYYGGRGYYRGDRYYGRGYDRRSYGGRGYCRDKGTGGTIIGAIAGGLLGHEIGNGRYDRGDGTTGAIVGAGVGALAGRAIDRDC